MSMTKKKKHDFNPTTFLGETGDGRAIATFEENKVVFAQFETLSKGMSKTVAAKEPAPAPGNSKIDKPLAPSGSSPPEKGYTYKIKDGDTLLRIVTDLRAQGYKITQKQVIEANAGVNWNRLKIGQTVFIA